MVKTKKQRLEYQKEYHKKNKENKYQLLCANCNWIKRHENKESIGRNKHI